MEDKKNYSENESAGPSMRKDARALYEVINGKLEVRANKDWTRVSVRPRESVHFVRRANGRFAVGLSGRNIERYSEYAIYHWGKPKREYHGPNGEHAWYWRLFPEEFTSTIVAVLNKEFSPEEDIHLVEDVEAIINNPELLSYEKVVAAKERIGHSKYAKEVKKFYGYGCAVQPSVIRNLIASHIKPWVECDGPEKTDVFNGIALSPNMDGLFEDGLISFRDNGQIMISGDLLDEERSVYQLTGGERIKVNAFHAKYLAWHREHKFDKG